MNLRDIASALTAFTVAAIAVAGSVTGGMGGSATGLHGTPVRAAPAQLPMATAAASLQPPAQTNAIYTPIAPCRAVDTRPARIAKGASTDSYRDRKDRY